MNKYMSVLKNVDFIKYFFSINFITLAQSFVSISIIWLIYEETKNPLLIAIFGVLTQLPAIVFGPLISKVLDRFNIGKAMFLFLLLRAGIFLIIFLLHFYCSSFRDLPADCPAKTPVEMAICILKPPV